MSAENAQRDQNNIPTLLAVSSADGTTPLKVYADPDSHRLLVDGVGATGPQGPTGATGATGATGPDAYTASSTGDWAGDPPLTFTSALDRVAAQLGPIS